MHNGLNPLAAFCKRLPKLEVHAHLNGSIPRNVLADLIKEKSKTQPDFGDFKLPDAHLARIEDFFDLFKVIYQLTDTEGSIKFITRTVIKAFHDDGVIYLELRTTPRSTPTMTKETYVKAVISALDSIDGIIVKLILSIDRRMTAIEADEVVNLAFDHSNSVVGLDLCGDVKAGHVSTFSKAFQRAREGGIKTTIHFAEIKAMMKENEEMLALYPTRLGHATYLDEESRKVIIERGIGIEICQSSNVLTRTVESHALHHLGRLLREGVPVLICTDDILVFNSTSSNEYYLAASHFDLSKEQIIKRLVLSALDLLFCDNGTRIKVRTLIESFAEAEGIKL